MTLLLAIVILVVLSLCIWAGLNFYQRRVTPKTRPGTGQRLAPEKSGLSRIIRIPDVGQTKEGEHGFTV